MESVHKPSTLTTPTNYPPIKNSNSQEYDLCIKKICEMILTKNLSKKEENFNYILKNPPSILLENLDQLTKHMDSLKKINQGPKKIEYDEILNYLEKEGLPNTLLLPLKIEIIKKKCFKNQRKTKCFNIQSCNFDHNTEEGQNALIKTAINLAHKNTYTISQTIKDYKIKDQKALMTIAKLTKGSLNKFIQNYGIIDEKDRIELAKLGVENHISEFIQNYDIKNQDALIEIAKMAAKVNGRNTSQFIQNYGIKDQKALIEIAEIAALADGEGVSEFIQNYGIKEQDALIKIAKIAAGPHLSYFDRGVAPHFKNYKIENEKDRAQIALISATHKGLQTSKFIQNFEITEEMERIKIASQVAFYDPVSLLNTIQFYQILNIQGRLEISKILIKQFPNCLISIVKNFNIDDGTKTGEKNLNEVLKLAFRSANLDALETTLNPNNIDKKYLVTEETIFCYDSYRTFQVMKKLINYKQLEIREKKTCLENIKKIFGEEDQQIQAMGNKIKNLYQALWQDQQENNPFALSIDKIINLPKPTKMKDGDFKRAQLQQLSFYFKALPDIHQHAIDSEQIKKTFLSIFDAEIKLHDPSLTMQVWDFIFENMIENKEILNLNQFKDPYLIPEILLTFLEKKGGDYKTIKKAIRARSGKNKGTPLLKDAFTKKSLIHTLYTLSQEQSLSSETKCHLLEDALSFKKGNKADKEEILQALKVINGIIYLGFGSSLETYKKNLDNSDPKSFLKFLKQTHIESFQKVIPLPSMDNFIEKIEQAFKDFKDPEAPIIYASHLKNGPLADQEKTLPALASCIQEIIDHKFHTSRYEKGEHLKNLFNNRSELKKEWMKGEKISLQDFLGSEISPNTYKGWTLEDTDDPGDLFASGDFSESCQRVNGNPELTKGLLGLLIDGKNRILVIKDERGIMRLRMNFRLLEYENKPILFIERIYGSTQEELRDILINFAKSRSKSMNVDLASLEVGEGKVVLGKINSHGTPAPYEYVDAKGGIKGSEEYSIENAHYLHQVLLK